MTRMAHSFKAGGLILLIVLLLAGCDQDELDMPGHDCEYIKIPGTATIIDVREADPDANNCANAVEVVFTFEPDDPAAREQYLWPNWPETYHLVVGDGKNPPREWAAAHGLLEDSVHRCLRKELTRCCPCTPVVYIFPEADLSGWEDECFPPHQD